MILLMLMFDVILWQEKRKHGDQTTHYGGIFMVKKELQALNEVELW